jgi:hypothetical protein
MYQFIFAVNTDMRRRVSTARVLENPIVLFEPNTPHWASHMNN